ncbi:MAG: 50S ribosomal protein L11 methyltransferase [Proteobacteria bacterium]|nr:50S ribosomal protein L11 methyltransferase [Pseudomonadota bacterium]MCL2310389.1 50S ribosomal protein L11 methyltransferase [Pseudomonadota bacterium]
MSYHALRFETAAEQAEAWSDALFDIGALSIDLSDPYAGTDRETPQYGEPGASVGSLWPIVRIDALFAGETESAALHIALGRIAASLLLPLPLFEIAPVAERDWVRETQAQFGPIAVTEDFWIVPTWSTPPVDARYILRLDPGLAFGTGSHPTTQLCLRWLRGHASPLSLSCPRLVPFSKEAPAKTAGVCRDAAEGGEHLPPSASVLDYGCGSGILLLAARLFGVGAHGTAFGTDIDPQALIASRENATANHLDAAFVAPDQLPDQTFSLVIANILANPLRALAPLLAGRTEPGGRLILSGILEDQQEELCACYAPWFEIAPWKTLDGWVLLSGVRKA